MTRRRRANLDQLFIRSLFQHCALQFSEPRPNWKPELFEAVLPNVDMCRLFDREGQARRTVFKYRGPDMEGRLNTKDSTGELRGPQVLEDESLFQAKPHFVGFKGACDLGDFKHQIIEIAINKVPAVRLQLVVNMLDEASRSIELERFFSPNEHSQQAIKSNEVIDVRVRYKNMLHSLKLAGRQVCKVAQVEKNGAPFEQSLDVQGRITGSPVHEPWMQKWPHF